MMKKAWWKESVVYQIYPRSFCDSNGDGIGDIRGIIQKLDYLKTLGIDVVWLSPVYKSPNDDNGYDISDYCDIMDEFGTLDDWRELFGGLHERGIKLVMDLVVNHTSDEHPWFQESRKSQDNPYRDYYIWRPVKDGGEPNNWKSFFGGSAWQYDEQSGEYYLHLFSKKQPDLNWENPKVRAGVYEMMHWWLTQGIDGFRMDVINLISKVPGLPDAPVVNADRYQDGTQYYANGPRLLEYLNEMHREVLSKYDLITVGETPSVTPQHGIALTNEADGPLKMVFQFEHMDLDGDKTHAKRWSLVELKQIMSRWQKGLEGNGWNSIYLENHDQARSVSRFGDDGEYRVESAKLLATLTHTLQGTPYIYQGEEIGMTNVAFETIDDYRDIESLNLYQELVSEKGMTPEEVLAVIHAKSRDNARTPMQWDAGPQAGFSEGTPWIRLNPNYTDINVKQALTDPDSVFAYYQTLIRLRKESPVFVYGSYDLLLDEHPEIYAYTRTLDDERLLVILNFSANTPLFKLPSDVVFRDKTVLLGNYADPQTGDLQQLTLRPFEACVYLLQ